MLSIYILLEIKMLVLPFQPVLFLQFLSSYIPQKCLINSLNSETHLEFTSYWMLRKLCRQSQYETQSFRVRVLLCNWASHHIILRKDALNLSGKIVIIVRCVRRLKWHVRYSQCLHRTEIMYREWIKVPSTIHGSYECLPN